LWHQWRALSNDKDKYTEENEFLDGHLMGNGPNHTFYVEHDREESKEMLYSVGFEFDETMNLHKLPANSCYSYIFRPKHINLIEDSLNLKKMIQTKNNPKKIIKDVECTKVLDLYIKQLKLIPAGKELDSKAPHNYHLLSSRIFFEIFRNQLGEPKIEQEINEGRGKIDFTCKNKNKEGVFKDLKEMRDIKCPEIFVECKNYENNLKNEEYSQLNDRLIPARTMLGFLLCRDKKDAPKVLKHCQDRKKGDKYIIVLDDNDLVELSNYKLNDEDDERVNRFIDEKIKEIID
jgi:hypothetical protein